MVQIRRPSSVFKVSSTEPATKRPVAERLKLRPCHSPASSPSPRLKRSVLEQLPAAHTSGSGLPFPGSGLNLHPHLAQIFYETPLIFLPSAEAKTHITLSPMHAKAPAYIHTKGSTGLPSFL